MLRGVGAGRGSSSCVSVQEGVPFKTTLGDLRSRGIYPRAQESAPRWEPAGPRGNPARGNGSPWGEVTAESHTRRDSILAPAYLAPAPTR